jgi:hypothetical protein
VWLEQRERRGQREEGGDRQVMQGPLGCRDDLGFDSEGGGSNGGLWAGEGGADSFLMGALVVKESGQLCRGHFNNPSSWSSAVGKAT